MNVSQLRQGIRMAVLCGCFTVLFSGQARAEYHTVNGPAMDAGTYVAAIEEGNPVIYVSMDSDEVLREGNTGEYYRILGDEGEGWLQIQVGDGIGYLSSENGVSIVEQEELEASEGESVVEMTASQQIADERRQSLVDCALQFLGCPYRDAGNDPHTGVDCSGFVRYVMQHGAGVSLNRSSRAQAGQGTAVSAEQMRPGDLVFYGSRGSINHVAMYIGDGQVIHASTYKTGVKLSPWTYRTPVRIANVLGD